MSYKAATMTGAVENIFSNGYDMEEMNETMYDEDVPQYEDIFSEEDVPLYDDEDAFSDVGYDSDECEVNLNKKRFDNEDSEDEIWEDDEEEEEDKEISKAVHLELLRQKNKKQLEGLSVLESKLNWLEKVPIVESDLDNDDYPVLGAIVRPTLKKQEKSPVIKVRTPRTSPKYMPAMITVHVGNKTYIEVERIICKAIKEGKTCVYGDKCKFSHDLPKPKIDYSTRLCNFIRNGEKCRFEERCKFSHDIKKHKPNNVTEQKAQKPMCRNGLNCENRKCTFTHPLGHKKAPVAPLQPQRVPNKSPKTRTPNSSPQAPLEVVKKKFRLCKNMFKVEGGTYKIIGECRFGNECMFAHSREEVEKEIKDNQNDFKCKHENCKGVEIEFIIKKDKDGKERKTRRYKNSATRKCFKIHANERVSDFIARTQVDRA